MSRKHRIYHDRVNSAVWRSLRNEQDLTLIAYDVAPLHLWVSNYFNVPVWPAWGGVHVAVGHVLGSVFHAWYCNIEGYFHTEYISDFPHWRQCPKLVLFENLCGKIFL